MLRLVFFFICNFPIILQAQRWAIRPELCLTAAKAKFVANTNPYQPFKATYSNNPDIYVNVDYYLKENNDRFTLSIGTFQQSFTMTGMEVKKKGYLGFIAPEFFLSEGTPSSGCASFSYAKDILNKIHKNSVFIFGGLQYYFLGPTHIGGAGGGFGNFILYDTEMGSEINGNLGWHAGINALIKNKKKREVMQFSFKYLGTFNTTQFTNDYYYSMITPTEPPEILKDQVLRYRLTGAGIQLGISKSLIYFPRQRKMNLMGK